MISETPHKVSESECRFSHDRIRVEHFLQTPWHRAGVKNCQPKHSIFPSLTKSTDAEPDVMESSFHTAPESATQTEDAGPVADSDTT